MKTIKLDSLLKIKDKETFISQYGLRSYNLWMLLKHSEKMGYKVPPPTLIDSNLSLKILRYFNKSNIQSIKSQNYLQPDEVRFQKYYEYLNSNKEELIEITGSVDNGISPIIRGTSCAEGYKNLSFAGICHSYIPNKNLSFEENTIKGLTKVLSSVYSPYAQYYFNSHNIPDIGKKVGIIMMKMLSNPIFHATAYVYSSEIRIRYFFTPQTGTIYKGGGDIIVNSENEEKILETEFSEHKNIWKHTLSVLRNLPSLIYDNSYPVDVELLIVKNVNDYELNIVQIRPLSDIHFENFKMSKNISAMPISLPKDISVKKSHLYYSVIDCFGKLNFSENFQKNDYKEKYTKIFVVKHQLGEGLFSFVSSLPKLKKGEIGLIVTHPNERSHDHFQYLIYEDERIKFVLHLNENLISELEDGMIVHMISNGNEAIIKQTGEFQIENLNIRFVDENSLPDANIVSAVFLVGFTNEKIIAARNERGWDVPGGHVNPTDSDLIAALKREVDEESGVVVDDIKPYAVLQFEGKEKVMLFYTSKNCKLVEFLPKEDAFERKLMSITEFISKYNWKKNVMDLLVQKALEVLK